MSNRSPPQAVGRYAIYDAIASGGMATVYYGRLVGPVGFARTVAIKRLHPHYAKDPEFVSMFIDEARLAARVRHPNVVQTLDIVSEDDELFLVLEYVHGESLARLLRAAKQDNGGPPLDIVSSILCGVLHGLHAAHEAKNELGEPMDLVHRDLSPHNLLVGVDGIPRVLDFGVAKAVGQLHTTRDGSVKGKFPYMAPEQLRGGALDRRTDLFAAGTILWEMLTGQRLFGGDSDGMTTTNVLELKIRPPSELVSGIPKSLDELTLRALDRRPTARFDTARQMALSLEERAPPATQARVGMWVESTAGDVLMERARAVARIEQPGETRHNRPDEPRSGEPAVSAGSAEVAHSQVSSLSLETIVDRRLRGRAWRSWALVATGLAVGAAAVVATRPRWSPSSAATEAMPVASLAPAQPSSPQPEVEGQQDHAASVAQPTPSASAPVVRTSARTSPSAQPKPCALRAYVDKDGIKQWARTCK
jgi:eukaryotic-like serine/threonine-protein kinase